MVMKTPRDTSIQQEKREQGKMRKFQSLLEDYLITHHIHCKYVKSAINLVPLINIRHQQGR